MVAASLSNDNEITYNWVEMVFEAARKDYDITVEVRHIMDTAFPHLMTDASLEEVAVDEYIADISGSAFDVTLSPISISVINNGSKPLRLPLDNSKIPNTLLPAVEKCEGMISATDSASLAITKSSCLTGGIRNRSKLGSTRRRARRRWMKSKPTTTASVLLHIVLTIIGGVVYMGIETLWRGRTHWSMGVLCAYRYFGRGTGSPTALAANVGGLGDRDRTGAAGRAGGKPLARLECVGLFRHAL